MVVKYTGNTPKINDDTIRGLVVCSKLVQHRECQRECKRSIAAFDYLSLPLAVCACQQGGFLIASPLITDIGGNQAEDLIIASKLTGESLIKQGQMNGRSGTFSGAVCSSPPDAHLKYSSS